MNWTEQFECWRQCRSLNLLLYRGLDLAIKLRYSRANLLLLSSQSAYDVWLSHAL